MLGDTTTLTAVAMAVAMLSVGAAFALTPTDDPLAGEDASTDAGATHEHQAAGDDGHQHSDDDGSHDHGEREVQRDRTDWGEADGEVPSEAANLTEVEDLVIEGSLDQAQLPEDVELDIPGEGTLEDPYVIERLHVRDDLTLKDTDAYVVVRETIVDGQLTLNYNGDKVHVHHNRIHDLRINENVERQEPATAGLIEDNVIDIVGQARHVSGILRGNTIGPVPEGFFEPLITDSGLQQAVPIRPQLALNIDGFHGAIFEDNTVDGAVDVRLHGHHHGSCFDCTSHNHAADSPYDHTVRWHKMTFRDNEVTVEDATAAFRYTDTNHNGNDVTADSEPEEELEEPHVHHQDLDLVANTFTGGSLVFDIVNADDRDHGPGLTADLTIQGNTVTTPAPTVRPRVPWFSDGWAGDALHVREATQADVHLVDNRLTVEDAPERGPQDALAEATPYEVRPVEEAPAGIHLDEVSNGTLEIDANTLVGARYGVLAQRMPADLTWTLTGTTFEDVDERVHTEDVANEPQDG